MRKLVMVIGAALAVGASFGVDMPEVEAMPATARAGFHVYTQTVPLDVGNYDVVFTFGDAVLPTVNFVKFEGRRLALDKIVTQPGETKRVAFTARVKGPIMKDDKATAEAPFPYALNLTVVSSAPRMQAPEITKNADARVIYLCGDSTVTDQQGEPWGSWGQCLPAFFARGTAVANFARSGLHTTSFRQQGRLDRILATLRMGDVVVIQFGHNDQKAQWLRPEDGYRKELNGYVDAILAKGATPVIVSPMERLRFGRDGVQQPKTLADYAAAAKDVAAARGVGFIDLNEASYRMYGALGAKDSTQLFCTYSIERQKTDFFGDEADAATMRNLADKTHHSIYGAYVLAHYIADELERIVPQLKGSRRPGHVRVDPASPEPDPCIPPTGVIDTIRPEGDTGNKE